MKKGFITLCMLILAAGVFRLAYAQTGDTMGQQQTPAQTTPAQTTPADDAADDEADETTTGTAAKADNAPQAKGHALIRQYFIQGGVEFMTPILFVLILGLALVIERIIALNLATVNTKKLLGDIENQLAAGNVQGAIEVTKATRGPVASIFYQGLTRVSEGIDIVEKSIVAFGSVQMSLLERGLIWLSLFIALAPMLGFLGTVVGMVFAFDAIEQAGDISPSIVAGGIKVALLTTVFGLIVAIILQLFYNYLVSKVDRLVHDMEDSSITFVDLLVRYKVTK